MRLCVCGFYKLFSLHGPNTYQTDIECLGPGTGTGYFWLRLSVLIQVPLILGPDDLCLVQVPIIFGPGTGTGPFFLVLITVWSHNFHTLLKTCPETIFK